VAKRALLSVYDKSGLVSLARSLAEAGWELIASGGTAQALREDGLPVTDVVQVTGAPEMLGGRVKTLHPALHAGILARDSDADRAELATQGLAPIDLVVCNLYPFRETVAQAGITTADAVEQIDVGGVALLRAAAKNYARVTVLCDPADYEAVQQALVGEGQVPDALRRRLAQKAFAHTRDYDAAIAAYLSGSSEEERPEALPETMWLTLRRVQSLRFGEHPHLSANLDARGANRGAPAAASFSARANWRDARSKSAVLLRGSARPMDP
jgi:phosphoribosylaminoimidazolecarboxamide formyltransferase/IMP cyclohydrolase